MTDMNGQIIAPPIPAGVEQDHHFTVQVRQVGTEDWVDIPTYAAWVDMHDVRQTAVGIFDFAGPVEVRLKPNVFYIHSAIVRPLSLGITADCDGHEVRFTLYRPADMMIEINKERFRCLHLFAGECHPIDACTWPAPHHRRGQSAAAADGHAQGTYAVLRAGSACGGRVYLRSSIRYPAVPCARCGGDRRVQPAGCGECGH